ncbi:MAG: alpha/beta fold hydrolase [Nocardioidaceae bacterium]|nr:alpha/beta fold hydrolase [Nocardioidaceae bacterium]NUS53230.1 alpha/beta fold hydrolase [Nocardioidaceae bacterium]
MTSRTRRWGRRLAVALLATVLVLTGSFYVLGGLEFSGQIRADALAVRPATTGHDLTEVRADRRRIVLDETAQSHDELASDGVFGITWTGGYGRLHGPASTAPGERVDRDFRLLRGRLPDPGASVGWSRNAFPDPRTALGRPVRAMAYDGDLGAMPAWFAPGRTDTWAVLVHGKGESRTEMLRLMRATTAAGLPTLAITYRNDVGAPRDPSGRYQYGRTEWRDLAAAVDHATAHGARRVVLVGTSMGGAVVASYLRHVEDHTRIAGLVLDAPMLDLGAVVSYAASRRALPVLGHVPASLAWTAKRFATLRYGVDWGALDYVDDTRWLDRPTLVFHGTDDGTVPVALSRRLAAAHPDLVTLREVPGAGHVASWNADPAAYERRVRGFLARL